MNREYENENDGEVEGAPLQLLTQPTSGLAEAIQAVKYMADDARKPVNVSEHFEEPEYITRLAMPDGTIQTIEAKPKARSITLESITDMVALAHAPTTGDKAFITYDHKSVVLHFDRENLREQATYPLKFSEEHAFFFERFDQPLVSVKDLVREMRLTLYSMKIDKALIERVGQLDTSSGARTQQTAARGRESMGMTIEAQVDEKIPLPKLEQNFNLRVFSNHDLEVRHQMTCLIDPDVSNARWYLRPVEESWNSVMAQALDDIGRQLEEGMKGTTIEVYGGKAKHQ